MLTRFTLKRIDPLAAGKVLACLYLVPGVLLSAYIAAVFALLDHRVGRVNGMNGSPMVVAGMFILAAPVIMVIVGFVSGILGSVLYNWVAPWTGGLEFELVDDRGQDD